jgi:hypothetical protein
VERIDVQTFGQGLRPSDVALAPCGVSLCLGHHVAVADGTDAGAVLVDDGMPIIRGASGAADKYVTYVFGRGAIEFTNCGAKVPAEMSRDPYRNGGEDTLISRNRKCFAPYGISFIGINDIASASPTDAELENGAFWELVNTGGANKEYINHKAIPIGRILSLG